MHTEMRYRPPDRTPFVSPPKEVGLSYQADWVSDV